ncbi:MAG: glycosyltransferase family 2 protein [Anaerolineae bacterium]|nr:glycosyltransferase family 2 protein [Anaerolineae bacterium]
MPYQPLVSIVVPTYNEEADIRQVLESLIALSYPNREIIVVDASRDRTPLIVNEYKPYGVTLLQQVGEKGRAQARNQGIQAAQGEIVIILNADVSLPPDFIQKILPHYRQGADYVLVEAVVSNLEFLFPRYVEARHHYLFDGQTWINWTEGFSCRREAALAAGLFPTGYPIPICAGEDSIFGERLEQNYKKVIDRSIIVTHVVPYRLAQFWQQRLGRGKGSPQILHFVRGQSLIELHRRLIKRTLWTILRLIAVYPTLKYAYHLIHHSERGWRDFIPFYYTLLLESIAAVIGEWQGYREIRSVQNQSQQ